MEKERRIKTISAITLIVAVLGLTVAFAVLSANLVINGTAKVEAGTWNIYFNNLSKAETKGGATAEDTATINVDDKTKIEDINVTLTKPMDEVIYIVELINGGNIDAEISSINGPNFSNDVKNYVEFSAVYEDKKPITEGDILRSSVTEKVTISIKFKKEVTELPSEELSIPLSYQINYVQTDKTKEEEAHKGEVSVPQIDYDSLSKGSEVSLGDEEFYVIENNTSEVKLLAKYNLLVGNKITFKSMDMDGIVDFENATITKIEESTPGYERQSSEAVTYAIDRLTWIGAIAFDDKDESRKVCDGDDCYYGYWSDNSNLLSSYGKEYPANVYDNNSSLYNHIENYKEYIKTLGYDVKEARLMTYDEAVKLGCVYESTCDKAPSWVYSNSYWLGTAKDNSYIYHIIGTNGFSLFQSTSFNIDYGFGLRPIIVLNK